MKFNAGVHLAKGIEQPLTFCIGFRQYLHFHLHAIKQQLHSKMRIRVNAFEGVIKKARRDPENAKTWRESFVGQSHDERETKEEKKVEEVFVHK